MKPLVVIVVFSLSLPSLAWTDVGTFEAEASSALSSPAALTNTAFVCSLSNACQVVDSPVLRLSALMVRSVLEYQHFCDTGDRTWAERCSSTLSNAVSNATALTNECNYWTAQVLYSGSAASQGRYQFAYSLCTNLVSREAHGDVMTGTNRFTCAIMSYYKMPGLSIPDAARYIAGMAAAVQGFPAVATNFASQVASPYREEILDFIQ